MDSLTEKITLRLTLSEFNAISASAKKNCLSKSAMIRQIVKKDQLLGNDKKNQKMLVEILMILRSNLSDDEHNGILTEVDIFNEKINKP